MINSLYKEDVLRKLNKIKRVYFDELLIRLKIELD
jgi:hypothetical protein